MSEVIHVSAGVFTWEQDASALPTGIAGIGAAIIGRTQKGPAFKPYQVNGWTDFEATFGTKDVNMYVPYAAAEYLKNQNTLNVVRTLGVHSDEYAAGTTTAEPAGFTSSMALAVCHSGATNGWEVDSILHTNIIVTATGTLNSVVFDFASGYNDGNPFTGSYVRSTKNYIEKVLSMDPTKYVTSSVGHYIWQNFAYNSASLGNALVFSGTYGSAVCNCTYSMEYQTAATSWIYSQNFGASSGSESRRYRLFRLVAKDDGEYPNSNIKATVSGIRKTTNILSTEFGAFDITVRKFDDTDKKAVILEQFTNCSLNPDDTVNYIARKIGDRYSTWDTVGKKFIEGGEFDSLSKYIRVELDDTVKEKTVPAESLPWGFYGYPKVGSGSFAICSGTALPGGYPVVPNLPYVSQLVWKGDFDSRISWGVAFNDISGSVNYGISDRMKIIPATCTSTEYDSLFSLDYLSSSEGAKTTSTSLTSSAAQSKVYYRYEGGNVALDALAGQSIAKFTLPFYGGFDGFDIHRANPIDNKYMGSGEGNTSTSAWDTSTYLSSYEICSVRRGIDVIRDPESIDFNLLVIPGIFHPGVVNYATQMIEDRADAFYIMDISGSTVSNVQSWMNTAQFDTNYAATYYPFVKYYDEVNSKDIWLPPSVAAFGAYAYNDRVGQCFYAPAGFNRASIAAKDVKDRTTYLDRNALAQKSVNPIARFPQEGIVIWGQKTLQVKESALTRVNVRRLMIFLRKTIASAARYLVFVPNVANTWERFVNLATPILDDTMKKYGIEKYKIVFDATTNTPELIMQQRMAGKIFVIPVRSAESIEIGFIISPQGADFTA